jgi:hypothetical protein
VKSKNHAKWCLLGTNRERRLGRGNEMRSPLICANAHAECIPACQRNVMTLPIEDYAAEKRLTPTSRLEKRTRRSVTVAAALRSKSAASLDLALKLVRSMGCLPYNCSSFVRSGRPGTGAATARRFW